MKIQDLQHYLLLIWLTITGLIVFGLVVSWNEGLITLLVDSDRSKICILISLIYLVGTIHCARRILLLSEELNHTLEIHQILSDAKCDAGVRIENQNVIVADGKPLPLSMATSHMIDMLRSGEAVATRDNGPSQSNLFEIFAAKLKGPHDIGWFMVDSLLKLGLVGTIVGFILMLGSVANTAALDVNTMQKVLRQMSSGMGTALFTTLAGLVGSMLLGAQYLLLDKGADELIERAVRLVEVDIKPFIIGNP